MNILSNMCSDVLPLLFPNLQSYIRSAGSVGADAFNECVERGLISAAIEAVNGFIPVWCPTGLVNNDNGALPSWLAPLSPGLARYSGDDLDSWVEELVDQFVPGVHLITSANAMVIHEHPLSYINRDDIERDGSLIPTHTLTILYAEGLFITSQIVSVMCPINVLYRSVRDERPLQKYLYNTHYFNPTNTTNHHRPLLYSLFENDTVESISIPPNALKLSGITEVLHSFFYMGSGLKSPLDLSFLSCITVIGNDFMWHCSGLTQLDLTPLGNVTRFGERFMLGCSGIIELDVQPLRTALLSGPTPVDMLKDCTSLKKLIAAVGTTYPSLGEATIIELH